MTGHRVSESPVNARIDPVLFARGMAVLRIFFGPILFANGLAKLDPALGRIDAKPFHTNLITREGARGILDFEVNDRQIPKDAPTLRPARPAVSNPQAMSTGSEFAVPSTLRQSRHAIFVA